MKDMLNFIYFTCSFNGFWTTSGALLVFINYYRSEVHGVWSGAGRLGDAGPAGEAAHQPQEPQTHAGQGGQGHQCHHPCQPPGRINIFNLEKITLFCTWLLHIFQTGFRQNGLFVSRKRGREKNSKTKQGMCVFPHKICKTNVAEPDAPHLCGSDASFYCWWITINNLVQSNCQN